MATGRYSEGYEPSTVNSAYAPSITLVMTSASPTDEQNKPAKGGISDWISFLQRKPQTTSSEGRRIPLSTGHDEPLIDERTDRPHISNSIRTSRYTLWNFVPKQVIYQFSRLPNFYFLVIACLQVVPGLSTTGQFTTIVPLLIFVALTISKEGYDDWKRYQLDKEENARGVTVLRPSSPIEGKGKESSTVDVESGSFGGLTDKGSLDWRRTQWSDIKVGEIIRLHRDDDVPADIVLLHGDNGLAYVDTRALDGETNLKSKLVSPALKDRNLDSIEGIQCLQLDLVIEHPNKDLYTFDGTVTTADETLPLSVDNVIYRGCIIRNTSYAIGMVINTGEDCKIRMNANRDPDAKRPALEKMVNLIVVFLAVYMLVLSLAGFIGFIFYWRSVGEPWYLLGDRVPNQEVIMSFIIMFSNVVPMSLIMAVEAIRLNLSFLLSSDLELYHKESDTPAGCNSNIVIDDLGQIGYVFSDKTGTLTDNVMKFRRVSVAGTSYLHRDRDLASDDPKDGGCEISLMQDSPGNGELTTDDLIAFIQRRPDTTNSKRMMQYLLSLAICHTCLPEIDPEDGSVMSFQASSPDELALVQAAQEMGLMVVERSPNSITLHITGIYKEGAIVRQSYEILDVIEFSSKRKRMSIIVRRPDGSLWLICKGADTILLPRLKLAKQWNDERLRSDGRLSLGRRQSTNISHRRSSEAKRSSDYSPYERTEHIEMQPLSPANNPYRSSSAEAVAEGQARENMNDMDIFRSCFQHIDDYAREGLRTLVFAHRILSDAEYQAWKRDFHEAQTSLTDRQQRIEEVGEQIEHSFELLGASGVEDKLQDGVPEAIDRLRRADIKIWMLTGDKRETAIEIAHSSRICTPETELFQLDIEDGDLERQLLEIINSSERQAAAHSALVIDGATLGVIEEPDAANLRQLFYYTLIPTIDSVICCRASPSQKALLVKAVRNGPPPHSDTSTISKWVSWFKSYATPLPRPLTLAIGDGANDLAMITAANIGVGISGREGQQAARVADISLAQFRFLSRVLLVHGRWNYHRMTRFILASFWKEMFFYIPAALYQIYAGYTGTSLYESTALTIYGAVFTTLSTVLIGCFEKDLGDKTLMAIPELYAYGQKASGLNWGNFIGWMANAVIAGFVVSAVAWAGYGGAFTETPDDNNLYAFGTLVFITCIIWINIKILILEMQYKTVLVIAAFAGVMVVLFAYNLVTTVLFSPEISPYAMHDAFTLTFGRDLAWWATLLVALMLLGVAEVSVEAMRQRFAGGSAPAWLRLARDSKYQTKGGLDFNPRLWKEVEGDSKVKRQLEKTGWDG